MSGQLYGVGVGPGDPELLTLKAVRVIKECEVVAVPGLKKEETVSYAIVLQAVPELSGKFCLELDMPMTKDKEKLEQSHKAAFEKLEKELGQGKSVAFLTLGDPCIYSTYLYMHQRAIEAGFQTEIINGIPSFCAVAAKLNQGLVEKSQMLHIIPSTYGIGEGIQMPGTKVLMKPGKKLNVIREGLAAFPAVQVSMVENCGMEGERVHCGIDEIPDKAGYYSLMVVKEKEL